METESRVGFMAVDILADMLREYIVANTSVVPCIDDISGGLPKPRYTGRLDYLDSFRRHMDFLQGGSEK
jgi:hypothetical protein